MLIQDRLLEEDASKVGVTYSILIEIATTKEAAMNEKSGWKKEECADLKYQKKNNGHFQAKQGFNTSKEQKNQMRDLWPFQPSSKRLQIQGLPMQQLR